MTTAAGDAYVKDILAGDESVLGRTIHPPISVLRVVAGSDGAKLNVNAADANGRPVPYAAIAIIPATAGTVERFAEATKLGRADQSGAWKPGLLAPGRYLVLATNDPLDMKAYHIDKLWAARSRAKEIELKPNADLQVKLNVQDLSGQ